MRKNILTFGIARNDFTSFLTRQYPAASGWGIWCAESRPYERLLASQLEEYLGKGYETRVITDNMIAYCLSTRKVEQVFLFYQKIEAEVAHCQGGSLLIAVLARELGVCCNLHPGDPMQDAFHTEHPLSFFGRNLAPEGVRSFIPGVEKIPLNSIAETW